ncbi:MAG: ERF family protein [Thermodesulfobacteriota bacterium]
MKHSEVLDKIAVALAKAQSEMAGAVKGSNNPFFKSKYADLTSVWVACKEALHNNGLSVIQSPVSFEGRIGVSTMLLHSSGQFVQDEYTLGVKKENDPQADGSSITYARRYALAAFVGVCPEDDDAEKGMHRGEKPKPSPKTPSKGLSEKQGKMIASKCKAKKITSEELLKHFEKKSMNEFTMADVTNILLWIDKKFVGYESKVDSGELEDLFGEDK